MTAIGTGSGAPQSNADIIERTQAAIEALVSSSQLPADKMDQANRIIMEAVGYYNDLAATEGSPPVTLERIIAAYAAINNQDPDFWNGRSWA